MIFLGFFLLVCEIIRCLALRELLRFLKGTNSPKPPSAPPKSRGSFVVKRMEQRLKEAMYPEE